MKKYITIKQKLYPNPYTVYQVGITRYKPRQVEHEYEPSEERTLKILDMIGPAHIDIELEGGEISLYGIYPGANQTDRVMQLQEQDEDGDDPYSGVDET